MPRALLLVADGYHDRDVHDVASLLHTHGWETRTCGHRRGDTYTGEGGRTVTADLGYMNVNMGAYDLLIVPGGPGADALAEHKSLYNIAYSLLHKGRTVATIGTGIKVLVAAAAIKQSPNPVETGIQVLEGEILRGREVTAPETLHEELEKAGAKVKDAPIVCDGPVVTTQDVEEDHLQVFVGTVLPIAQHHAAMIRSAA